MNIKKLFPEKRVSKKSIIEFFDKKGFYIVLVLCIALVGATAVFVTTHNITSPNAGFDAQKIIPEEIDKNAPANAEAKAVAQSSISTVPASNGTKENTANKNTEPSKNAAPDANKQALPQKDSKNGADTSKPSETKPSAAAKTQKFIQPVFGDVTFEYAQDKLVYSKTLDEWRAHSGVDLSSDRGTNVKAVADGVVSDIKNDPRLGIIVILDHQNGIKTVYANLASDGMVAINQKVKQGDIIGAVGNTASFESAEQSHLHFEVLKNNTPVDPMAYLPKK